MNNNLDGALNEFAGARPFMLEQEMAALIGCVFHQARSMSTAVGKLLPHLPQSA